MKNNHPPKRPYYCHTEDGVPYVSSIHEKGFENMDNARIIWAVNSTVATHTYKTDLKIEDWRKSW